jgi:hypothetical protein
MALTSKRLQQFFRERLGICSCWWCILKTNGQFESSALERPNPRKGDDLSCNHQQGAEDDDMRKVYDFTHAVRGKYADRFPVDVVTVTLAPDVAEAFPDADSVNEALRGPIRVAKKVAPAA